MSRMRNNSKTWCQREHNSFEETFEKTWNWNTISLILLQDQDLKDFGFNYEFEDVSHIKKSHVWKFFLFNQSQNLAKCKFCGKFMSASGGTTSTMMRHIKSKHSTILSHDNPAITDNKWAFFVWKTEIISFCEGIMHKFEK